MNEQVHSTQHDAATQDQSDWDAVREIRQASRAKLEDLGYVVFPLFGILHDGKCQCTVVFNKESCEGKPGKHPAMKWRELTRTPKRGWSSASNIGVPCGTNRLLVLDEDASGEVERFCTDHGVSLPETFQVRTGRGIHYWFHVPSGWHIGNGDRLFRDLGYEINVRADGGYVVGPGSVHKSGSVYEAVDWDIPLADAPLWLLERLHQTQGHPKSTTATVAHAADQVFSGAGQNTTVTAFGRSALKDEVERLLQSSNGNRNNALNTAAFRMGQLVPSGHLTKSAIVQELLSASDRLGLVSEDGEQQTVDTIHSGIRGGIDDPRQIVPPIYCGKSAEVSNSSASSWEPVDLGPYLFGEIPPPRTTDIGAERVDGLQLLYTGLEHAIFGESESGKSWLALLSAIVELEAGRTVLYVHFEENDARDTVVRLLALGASPELIYKGMKFVGPEQPSTDETIARLKELSPSMVILDGQNEAMSLHDQRIREEEGVADYRRRLVKPFTAIGATVVSLDHVVKDPERNRDGYALGSAHKLNGLNGAAFLLENKEPFGVGRIGVTNVFTVKDRPGHLRQNGQRTKVPRKFYLGSLIVDGTCDPVEAHWTVPAPSEDGPKADQGGVDFDERVFQAVAKVEASPNSSPSIRAIRAAAAGVRGAKVDEALERLKLAGRVEECSGPRGARLFSTVSHDQHQ